MSGGLCRALLFLVVAYAPGLRAQVVVLTPHLGLYTPLRDFVHNPGSFKARFATTVAYGGTLSVRPIRPLGLSVSGNAASPHYNFAVAGFGGGVSFRGSTSGRMSQIALQVSGYADVGDRSSISVSLGPLWIQNKSRLLPSETSWVTYKSTGISASLRLHHRFGRLFHGSVTVSDATYGSDVANGGRQHDMVLLVGLGLGYTE